MTVSSPTFLTDFLAQLDTLKTEFLGDTMRAIWQELSNRPDCGHLWVLWPAEFVRCLRPDLTDEQCREVLRTVEDHYDPDIGINWDVIGAAADILYPEPENLLELREQYEA